MVTVGIPKAFMYYRFFPMWKNFFENLGVKVVISKDSNKLIVKNGIDNTIDEACLPLKTYMGHVLQLAKLEVDYIFIPRFISIEKHRYFCPKFLGLPDIVKGSSLNIKLPKILAPDINIRTNQLELYMEIFKLARKFNKSPKVIFRAVDGALKAQQVYEQELHAKLIYKDTLNIAVIGHSYLVNDKYLSIDLVGKLEEIGCNVLTTEMVGEPFIEHANKRFSKDMFWTLNRELLGAAMHYLEDKQIDGLVILTAFSCGPDAISKEMIERIYKKESNIPLLSITIDEHTGEAGFVTRLEAFIDMIKRKQVGGNILESNVSAHG